MKKLLFFIQAMTIVTLTQAQQANLRLDKNYFAPGENINVYFNAPAGLPGNAWVGIIPSHIQHGSEAVNDKNDLAYKYLESKTSGTLIFSAPVKEGNYDFRLHNTDNNGKELYSVTFTVGKKEQTVSASATYSIRLNKTSFSPGEKIALSFTAPTSFADNAWIGIVPSNIKHGSEAENDKNDIAYQYLKKQKNGTLYFNAPSKPGTYDFRMHDTDNSGKEVYHITFTVN